MRGGVFFFISVAGNTLISYSLIVTNRAQYANIFNYINPLVILGSAGLLMIFTIIKIKYNRFINWVAASSFAVFLVHCNPNLGTPYFKPLMQTLFSNFSSLTCLSIMFGVLVAIFLISILLDQPRKWLWKILSKRMFKTNS